MRARPAQDAEEPTEVEIEIALESTTGDASRLMRQRPSFEAEPAADDTVAEPAADDTASDDASRLMRVRPAFNEAEPTEVEMEIDAEPAAGDAARLMRARPAF